MYTIPCKCGTTSKNFKFKIGDTFRAPCCLNTEPTKVAKEPKKSKKKALPPKNVADLNDDGVVDEKDATILLTEMGKAAQDKIPETEEDILSFLDED